MTIILLSLATLAAFGEVRDAAPKTVKKLDASSSCGDNADLGSKLEVEPANDKVESIRVDLAHARFMRLRDDITDKKCANKIFAQNDVSLSSCALRCKQTAGCAFVSIKQSDMWCMGCASEPTKKSAHTKTYQLGTVEKNPSYTLVKEFIVTTLYEYPLFYCTDVPADNPASELRYGFIDATAASANKPNNRPQKERPQHAARQLTGNCRTNIDCVHGFCKRGFCCAREGLESACLSCNDRGECDLCSETYKLVDGACVNATELGQSAPEILKQQQYQPLDPSMAAPVEEHTAHKLLERNVTEHEDSAPPLVVDQDLMPLALAVELELLRDLHLEGLLSHQELDKQQMVVLRAHGRLKRYCFCCL